jgi:hypothetical protein
MEFEFMEPPLFQETMHGIPAILRTFASGKVTYRSQHQIFVSY